MLPKDLNQGVDRMRGVVNEIIKVARIASGTLDLALGPVRLSESDRGFTTRVCMEIVERRVISHYMSAI